MNSRSQLEKSSVELQPMINISTSASLRCFIAIASPLAEAARPLIHELESLASYEKFRLRIAPPENLHITLKFIGSVAIDQTGLLDSVLRNQSTKQATLHLNCRGIGFFDNSLYIGIGENDALSKFTTSLNEAFTFLGYPIQSAKFLPHITLARFRPSARRELTALLAEAYRDSEWGDLTVESIQLFSSETLSEGAKYTSIGNYPLLAKC